MDFAPSGEEVVAAGHSGHVKVATVITLYFLAILVFYDIENNVKFDHILGLQLDPPNCSLKVCRSQGPCKW